MPDLSPAQLAADAIALYLEYRDVHGYAEDAARAAAIAEVVEGTSADALRVEREVAAEREYAAARRRAGDRVLAAGGSEPDDDLPY